MNLLVAFFTALPAIIKLLQTLLKNIEAAETDRKVKDDLAAIDKAVKDKDAEALSRIFNNT